MDAIGPVAIGGVGGSGTRVIASIVSSLGYHAGADLSDAEDDLTFSILFKRPYLYQGVRGLIPADHPAAIAATKAFVSLRGGHPRLNSEMLPIFPASVSFPLRGNNPRRSKPVAWSMRRLQKAFQHTAPPERGLWTWKEPNTLLFLPTLFREVSGLRYVHVVRNGLSMVKSKNYNQLTNWGYLFDTPLNAKPSELQQLVYWARANLAVSDFLSTQPRSLVITHERAVLDPMGVVELIASFLGRSCTAEAREIAQLVRRPDDFERTYEFGDSDLTDSERDDVRRALVRFGYRSDAG